MTEAATPDEVRDDDLVGAYLQNGALKIRKTSKADVPLPSDSEDPHFRIRLMGVASKINRLQYPANPFLGSLLTIGPTMVSLF